MIPVLMYHSIGNEDHSGRHAYFQTAVSPETFSEQMEHLHRGGYRTCTPAEAVALLASSAGTGERIVVITFDDGYRDFYFHAFPVLSQFRFSATVFLPTSYIGRSAKDFKGRKCLTWPEIRELQRHGMAFGSHTVSHPQLRTLDRVAIEKELTDSKKAIEDSTGLPVESFAYPYAFPQVDIEFRRMLRSVLQAAGYRSGVCTIVGRTSPDSDPYFLERLPVNDADDAALFEAKLRGAYDWVGWLQSTAKKVRSVHAGLEPAEL
ncbi:MAG TPA: polysaccharide deacetylase family protein [Acidobacteriaceae bacterium]|nr:polysaccharide deacetylase family protein [Acidobacteriaceae bacterium]